MTPRRVETEHAAWTDDLRGRFDELLEEYRRALRASLGWLTEEEVRVRLVPSRRMPLGLLRHVTYVEGVWFDQAVTCGTTREVGIPSSPERSFVLTASDTMTLVLAEHERRCELSRRNLARLHLSEVVDGRGERTVLGALPPGAARARPARRARRHPARAGARGARDGGLAVAPAGPGPLRGRAQCG